MTLEDLLKLLTERRHDIELSDKVYIEIDGLSVEAVDIYLDEVNGQMALVIKAEY